MFYGCLFLNRAIAVFCFQAWTGIQSQKFWSSLVLATLVNLSWIKCTSSSEPSTLYCEEWWGAGTSTRVLLRWLLSHMCLRQGPLHLHLSPYHSTLSMRQALHLYIYTYTQQWGVFLASVVPSEAPCRVLRTKVTLEEYQVSFSWIVSSSDTLFFGKVCSGRHFWSECPPSCSMKETRGDMNALKQMHIL